MVFGMKVNTTACALWSTSKNKEDIVENWNAFQQPTNLLPALLPPKKRRWILEFESELAVDENVISHKCVSCFANQTALVLPAKKRHWIVKFESEPEITVKENQNRIDDEANHHLDITEIKDSDTEVPQKEHINNDKEEVGKVMEETVQCNKDETEEIMLTANASSTPSINANYVLEEENKDFKDLFSESGDSEEITSVNSVKMLIRKQRTERVVIANLENRPLESKVTKPRSNLERKPRKSITLKFNEGFEEKENNIDNDIYSMVKSRSRPNKMSVEQSRNNARALATRELTEVANGESGTHGGRCTRRNGRGWRCSNLASSAHLLCDHHLFLGSRAKTNAQQRKILQKKPMKLVPLIDIYRRTKEVELD